MNSTLMRRGAIAGAVAGMAMAMWSMAVLLATGAGFWTPLNLIAHTLWHGAPVGPTFSGGAMMLGLMVHMAVSMMPGASFAAAASRCANEDLPDTELPRIATRIRRRDDVRSHGRLAQ